MHLHIRGMKRLKLITTIIFASLILLSLGLAFTPVMAREGGATIPTKVSSSALRAGEVVHVGDLVVEGTRTLTIENCRFVQTGNIIVRETAALIIRNAELVLNQSYNREFSIVVEDYAGLTVEKSTITSGYWFEVHITELTTATISGSTIDGSLKCYGGETHLEDCSIAMIECLSGATLTVEGCTARVSCRGGDLTIEDSILPDVTLDMWDAKMIISNLRPGTVTYWDLRKNNTVWWVQPSFVIRNSEVGGWSVEVGGASTVSIYSSELKSVGLHFIRTSNLTLTNLPTGSFERWDLYEDNSVIEAFMEFTMEGVTVRDPWRVSCYGASGVRVLNLPLSSVECYESSNLTLVECRVEKSALSFDDSLLNVRCSTLSKLYTYDHSTAVIRDSTVTDLADAHGFSRLYLRRATVSGDVRCFGESRLYAENSAIAGCVGCYDGSSATLLGTPAEGGIGVYDTASTILGWFLNVSVTVEYQPVEGALVSVYYVHNGSLAANATTGADGKVGFPLVEKVASATGVEYFGDYIVAISYGNLALEKRLTLSSSMAVPAELLLRTLSVRCVDGDGEAVEGVTLRVYDVKGREAAPLSATSATGWATISRLLAGKYTLKAYWLGVEVASMDVDLSSGDLTVDPLACRVYDVSIHVVDEAGKGVAWADVKLAWPNGTVILSGSTGSDGCIQFVNVPSGSYLVKASAWGFSASKSISLEREGEEVAVTITSPIPIPLSQIPIFIAAVAAVLIGSGVGWRTWRAAKLKPKAREEMLKIIRERGWVNLKDLSKESILSEKEIRKLIEQALASKALDGYFGKDKKIFVTKESLKRRLRSLFY